LDILKFIFKNVVQGGKVEKYQFILDSISSNKPSGFINGAGFVFQLSEYSPLKTDPAECS
jgi:hypothetical protein